VAKKKATKKRPAKPAASTKRSPPAAAKAPAKKQAVKAVRAAAPVAAPDPPALGRVLVTQEEKLYMLFREDFHARQIFEFLRVETVKDLEQFSPQQIVKLLSQPLQKTVQRIRQKLAEKNRHLQGDESFVVEYKQRGTDA
jgi:hypothetical protein